MSLQPRGISVKRFALHSRLGDLVSIRDFLYDDGGLTGVNSRIFSFPQIWVRSIAHLLWDSPAGSELGKFRGVVGEVQLLLLRYQPYPPLLHRQGAEEDLDRLPFLVVANAVNDHSGLAQWLRPLPLAGH